MAKFEERWSEGKEGGTVVSDTDSREMGDDPEYVEYYGGYLVAESIPKQEYVNLITCSPSMLALLEKALPIIEVEADMRDQDGWATGPYRTDMRELANEIAQEIDKAYGRGVQDG